MYWPAAIANSLWIGSCLPAWKRFQNAIHRPAEVQHRLLQTMLMANTDCAYGRAHGFAGIKNYLEFSRRVPLASYADLEPWIARIRSGESRVLTNEPISHLIPTSGSSGARKLIPFTAGLQAQLNLAIGPWMVELARQHPKILFGPAYWSITPKNPSVINEVSVVPIGFADDARYLGGIKSRLVRMAMVTPENLSAVCQLDEFRFCTLLGLLRSRDLRLISVWHPSFLTLLLDALPTHWDKILDHIRKEHPARYDELKSSTPHAIETLWPQLTVISCWGDSHAGQALNELRRRLPNVFIQPKGILATEAFLSIPMGRHHPAAVCSHFFEFIASDGKLRLLHELQPQETYEAVVTTAGGLWRYRTNDLVQVTGIWEKTPTLRFIGRSGNVSDLFGEKLAEAFVATAIQETLAECDARVPFVFLAPEEEPAGWGYTLFIQGRLPASAADGLEARLRRNPNYAHCRDLQQLQAVRIFHIADRGYEFFTSRLIAAGMRLGEIKPTALSKMTGWKKFFSQS